MKKLTKSEMLFTTINGMTSSQKKMFRMEMEKFTKQGYYVPVFNYMDDILQYKKKDFENFIKEKKVPNHYSVVNYLLDKLVVFIYQTRTGWQYGGVIENLKNWQEKAKAMLHFSYHAEAIKLWKKMLDLADKHSEYQYVSEAIVNLDLFGQSSYLEDFKYRDNLQLTVYERLKKIGLLETNAKQLKVLQHNVIRLSRSKTATMEDWQKIEELNLLNTPPSNNYSTNVFYSIAKGYYILKTGDVEEATAHYKEFALSQSKFISISNFDYMKVFDADYLYLISLYWCCQPKKYIAEAHRFNGLMNKYQRFIYKNNKTKQLRMLGRFALLNGTVQAYRLTFENSYKLEEVQNLAPDENSIHHLRAQASLLLKLAYLCILIREYEAFYNYKTILSAMLTKLKSISYLKYEFRIIELIELYENNTNKYFSNQLKRFSKKIKTKTNVAPSILKMVSLMKKLRKSKQPKVLMSEVLLEFKEQEKIDFVQEKSLSFCVWLKKRSTE